MTTQNAAAGAEARCCEMLRQLRAEVDDVKFLVVSACRLVDGVVHTGNVEDAEDADEAAEAAHGLLSIAGRQLTRLCDAVDKELARERTAGAPGDARVTVAVAGSADLIGCYFLVVMTRRGPWLPIGCRASRRRDTRRSATRSRCAVCRTS